MRVKDLETEGIDLTTVRLVIPEEVRTFNKIVANYAFLVSLYRSRTGVFMSVDPLSEKQRMLIPVLMPSSSVVEVLDWEVLTDDLNRARREKVCT